MKEILAHYYVFLWKIGPRRPPLFPPGTGVPPSPSSYLDHHRTLDEVTKVETCSYMKTREERNVEFLLLLLLLLLISELPQSNR